MRTALAAAMLLAGVSPDDPTPATIAALPPSESVGRGAAMPFVTLEAEDGRTTGTVIGPDRSFGSFAAEASGRRAVRLDAEQALVFVLPAPADAITLRYALPDSPDGRGLDGRLALFADGARIATLPLTSRYAWLYGRYPFTNRPADGAAHHFYDHVRLKLGRLLPAGTRVTLRREAGDATPWTIIDLADFERVPPPRPMPPGARSVLDFGADPGGGRSSLAAFRKAIAGGGTVWIPPGTYRIDGHLDLDRVTLAGAGHWHSELAGDGVGIFGKDAHHVELRDFAILGEVAERVDSAQLQGVGGAFSNSTIADLWIQHTKVGLWLDGPMDRLTVRGLRVYDQMADGVNFHRGVTRSVVEDSFFRNLGDDGLAMWSHERENAGNVFRRNTVIAPVLANGIAIYGGRDISVDDNLVADIVTQGGGLHFGTRFDATPFAGTIRLAGNMVARGGVMDPNWRFGVGALWFFALDHPIAARIEIADTLLLDSGYEAVQFHGKAIRGVTIDGLTVRGAGTSAFQLQSPGEAIVRNSVATGLRGAGVLDAGQGFRLVDGGGNRGWERRAPFP
ncbi:MAG: glycosyl hydrolase family 28-related protein [Sphingomonas sp.]